jgi:D-arabinose 1-dehydrogenase-like Zn-dependent alcohol dehydrogenase
VNYVVKDRVKVIAVTCSLDGIGDAYEKVTNGNVLFRALIKE